MKNSFKPNFLEKQIIKLGVLFFSGLSFITGAVGCSDDSKLKKQISYLETRIEESEDEKSTLKERLETAENKFKKQKKIYKAKDIFYEAKELKENKEYQAAVDKLEEAIELDEKAIYWNEMGANLLNKNSITEAIKAYNKAIELDPSNTKFWSDSAVAYLTRAAELFIEMDKAKNDPLFIASEYRKQIDEALEKYLKNTEQTTKIEPENAENWNALGVAYKRYLEKPEKAIEPFQRAVKLDPKNDKYWYHLGATFLETKNYDNAISVLAKAISLNKNNADYWGFLGLAYLNTTQMKDLEKFQKAEIAFENALKLNPGENDKKLYSGLLTKIRKKLDDN